MLKNNYSSQKIGISKKFSRSNDSESSVTYKKSEKYGSVGARESSYDKIKHHSYSNQSQERIEMNIQKILSRNGNKLFVVVRNQQFTHPNHPDYYKTMKAI